MASGGSFDEVLDDFYKRVLISSQKRLVSDADPVALLDVFLQKEFIDHDLYRDISELALTSQKNRKIIETVRSKGKDGYIRFKECLRESDQGHLADHLERNEKEIKQIAKKKTTQTIGKVSDEDLVKIANAIGKNWELLAPVLGLIDTEVDHLKMNYDTVQLCIYQMLMTWKKRSGETSTLPNLLSKIQSIPSVNVNMDYIYNNVSGAVMADSYQRSKPTRVMPQDVKGDLRLEPVENSVSISSGSNGGEDKYKQVEEQSSSSNIVDGVSPVKEQSEQQTQEESHNESKANSLEEVTTAEDQIDANATPSLELTTPTDETTYKNLNVNLKSEYDSTIKQPTQATQDETIDGVISVLSTLKTSRSQTSRYEEKDKGRGENKDFRLSTKIEVDMPAGSNDDSSSATRENRLKKEFRPPRHKPRRKCTHDGRLLICEERVFLDIKGYCNTNKPIEGGFGCVYISERKIPGLDIKVALKEMNCAGENEHFKHSATNEKLASRIMHFAIVPLLAMGCDTNERIYWFLSPCLDKGDLYTLIEKDTSRIENNAIADIELNRQRRLKILYHISAAIDFLHTEIENFRGAIIHLDVKTRNVVLDRFYNARLTDFGVARETTENETSIKTSPTAIPLTKGYFHPPTYDKLEKYFDYFNIGVVIRELLTGKHANFKYSEDSKEQYLKDLDEVEVEYNVQDNIWNDQKKLCQSAEILLTLSQQCIDSAKQSEVRKDDKLTSEDILKETQRLIDQFCSGAWERLPAEEQNSDDDNCEMCMINPSVDKDLLSHECKQKWPLKVCVSCMRNSYLNPMRCHSCFQEIDPVIGSKYGAVLLAGRYDDDMNFSNSCAIDVADIKKVIISKCPLVVGIREKYVRTITPSDSTSPEHSEDCISQLQRAFNDLKENDIKTIFFYYSGHYSKADGFIIQKRKVDTVVPSKEQEYKCEHLSLSNFKDMLRSFLVQNNGKTADRKDKNFIITLDCCEAPIIRLDDSASHDDNISQLNACRPDQAAIKEPDGSGSLFKKIFIQALTMKSTNDNCFLQRDGMRCGICPFMGEDFITIGSLNTYIGRHMKEYQKLLCTEPQMPLQYASSDVKIAYLVDSTSELSFTMKFGEIQKEYKIAYHFFNNTSQLKETLFNEFMDKMLDKEKDSQLQLKVDTYKDILQIVAKTGPKDKDKHKLKLNNLAQVMSAWNGKRELYVEMREISTIEDGMVGVFNDDTEKFLSFLDKCKYKKQEEPDHTTYKIDLALFLKVKDDSLKQLQVGILAYRKKEKNAELHIIRPCMRDAKGLRKMRDDFVCFKIEKVKTPLETADTESK